MDHRASRWHCQQIRKNWLFLASQVFIAQNILISRNLHLVKSSTNFNNKPSQNNTKTRENNHISPRKKMEGRGVGVGIFGSKNCIYCGSKRHKKMNKLGKFWGCDYHKILFVPKEKIQRIFRFHCIKPAAFCPSRSLLKMQSARFFTNLKIRATSVEKKRRSNSDPVSPSVGSKVQLNNGDAEVIFFVIYLCWFLLTLNDFFWLKNSMMFFFHFIFLQFFPLILLYKRVSKTWKTKYDSIP